MLRGRPRRRVRLALIKGGEVIVQRSRSAIRKRGQRRVLRFVLVIGALAVLPAAALARDVPEGGKIGSLTFSGQAHGQLTIPKKWGEGPGLSTFGCLYFPSKKTPLIRFYDEKISVNGHKRKIGELQLQLTVAAVGIAESLTPKTSDYSQVLMTLSIGSSDYVWDRPPARSR